MSDSTLIPNPNRLADRVCGRKDGLTLDQLIDRANDAVERLTFEWHGEAVRATIMFIVAWNDRCSAREEMVVAAMRFRAVADDMESMAEQLGYPDIAAAAGRVSKAMLADKVQTGMAEDVVAALAHLHRCLAEPRRVMSDGRDLLAA